MSRGGASHGSRRRHRLAELRLNLGLRRLRRCRRLTEPVSGSDRFVRVPATLGADELLFAADLARVLALDAGDAAPGGAAIGGRAARDVVAFCVGSHRWRGRRREGQDAEDGAVDTRSRGREEL